MDDHSPARLRPDGRGDARLPLEHVHVAPDAAGDGPDPAVFVLHGRGANEEDLLPVARRLPDALHVISLRAPDRLGAGYTWYDLDLSAGGLHQSQPDEADFERSLGLIADSVDTAIDAYGLDPDRVGLLGFSQGAISSLSALIERPDRYAWVVALHGYLAASHADEDVDLGGTPVFVGAGTADEIIPVARAEAAADRLDAMGAAVTYRTYDLGHGVGQAELTDVVEFVTDRTA
jgi:phospholipase/carboxylesterase